MGSGPYVSYQKDSILCLGRTCIDFIWKKVRITTHPLNYLQSIELPPKLKNQSSFTLNLQYRTNYPLDLIQSDFSYVAYAWQSNQHLHFFKMLGPTCHSLSPPFSPLPSSLVRAAAGERWAAGGGGGTEVAVSPAPSPPPPRLQSATTRASGARRVDRHRRWERGACRHPSTRARPLPAAQEAPPPPPRCGAA